MFAFAQIGIRVLPVLTRITKYRQQVVLQLEGEAKVAARDGQSLLYVTGGSAEDRRHAQRKFKRIGGRLVRGHLEDGAKLGLKATVAKSNVSEFARNGLVDRVAEQLKQARAHRGWHIETSEGLIHA